MDSVKPQCQYCEKTFSAKSNLLKHTRLVHKVQNGDHDTLSFLCREDSCSSKFASAKQLRTHLSKMHQMKFEEECLAFENINKFNIWKNIYEEQEDINFIKSTGTKIFQNGERRHYFNCHRSGHSRQLETVKRMRQKSHKLGFCCTASLILIEKVSGEVNCILNATHYGHKTEIGTLRLTANKKEEIASKLLQKIGVDDILSDIREDLIASQKPSRLHLTTKQDIRNVQKEYGLLGPQRHPNDAISVSIIINELDEHGDNPIIAHKFQGEKGVGFLKDLNDDDVFFVIQHPVQKVMLQKFGKNTVCIDSTHGTNKYGFNLITLLVIDEYEEGFPVAFCLCNREDFSILKIFFSVLKEKLAEQLKPCVFMSDDAPAYYNAWENVFGSVKYKLLCAWHVERALRFKLQSTIKDKELLSKVYKSICLLLEETCKIKFQEIYENMKDLFRNSNVKAFGDYFLKTYGNRIEEIAACYRINLGINTNMHLESFHRIFKYNFLKAKTNNRMDLCIFKICEFIKHIALERIKKIERGKLTNKMRLISQRHKSSLEMDFLSVDKKDGHYIVKSSSTDKTYMVDINSKKCQCKVKCRECGCCLHEITCTCEDYAIRHVLCKHCHLVLRKIKLFENEDIEEGTEETNLEREEQHDQNLINVEAIHKFLKKENSDLEECKQLLKSISEKLFEKDTETEGGVIRKTCSMLKDIDNFLTASTSNNDNKKFPAIKNEEIKVKPQRSFYVTRKKSGKKKNILQKATTKEKEKIYSEILNCDNSAPETVKNTSDHTYSKEEKMSTERKSHSIILTKEQQKLLKEILQSDIHIVFEKEDRISASHIKEFDKIRDSVIDLDFSIIKKLLTEESLNKLDEIIKKKKENWCCSMCSHITTKKDMVQCDSCLSWIHFECANIEEIQEKEPWNCCVCKNT